MFRDFDRSHFFSDSETSDIELELETEIGTEFNLSTIITVVSILFVIYMLNIIKIILKSNNNTIVNC